MRRILLVSVLCLSACAVAPKDAPQAAYELSASFVTALKSANVYAAMPRCSATAAPPCSDQATVTTIAAQANKANVAVLTAETIARDTTAATTDVAKANAAAQAAVTALAQLVPAKS